jgi:tetratricopeptide (TPR) repeat protein
MRMAVSAILAALLLPCAASAQAPKNASVDTRRANEHYAKGWSSVRSESWDDAVLEFEAAIDSDPKFALAYYSLGRAEMGRRDFAKAIDAYKKCSDLYHDGGQQFTNQMTARQRLDDRIRELQMALSQLSSKSSGTTNAQQSQNLMVRDIQGEIMRLQQARDQNISGSIDLTGPPYFVPMALGAAYFRNGQFPDAEREYKAAIASNSGSGETHNNLAVLYLMTGRFDDAESEVKAAEKAGFKVNENLKGDIKKKKAGGF